jgi:hypothetical protein
MPKDLIVTGTENTLLDKLKRERDAAVLYQQRRHDAWDEIYSFYRNKAVTNRLTQRQAVYVPLMKETIKTLLAKIDDPPYVDWKELSGDLQKELILQELWNNDFTAGNFEGVDIIDKKNVLLYGRSFKKLDWKDGRVLARAMDVYDIVIDPMCDPLNIEMARFIVHQNIFKTLREVLANKSYDEEAKNNLKEWKISDAGIRSSDQNRKSFEEKTERLKVMGVNDSDFATFAGGDVLVNIAEHLTEIWDEKKQKFVRYVCVVADGSILLSKKTLNEALGIDFWPYVSWGEDMETADFWADGPGDLVRTPNKLINIWFSQLTENRTLKNFQMHWYDATNQKYSPQVYDPGPGRMLPAPGNPRETIMPVEISGLDDTMVAIDFVTKLIERGTAATAIEKGTSERNQITLGEVQMLVGKATERTVAMAKHYRRSWFELASKWYAIMEANATKSRELVKMSSKGKLWPKIVYRQDWESKSGYKPFVRSSSEQDDEKTRGVQRFQFLIAQFPQNAALKRIGQKRMLELVDLTPEEVREIAEEEKKKTEEMGPMMEMGGMTTPTAPQMPTQPLI